MHIAAPTAIIGRVEPGIVIDVTFDMRTDAGGGDPDSRSATLRAYHRLLWSKPLPSGIMFDLDATLYHRSAELGEFWLSSDSITHSYRKWTRPVRIAEVVRAVPEDELKSFVDLAYTVGGFIVFPLGVQRDGVWQQSINQRRGTSAAIRDRFDLTLECIRRHYTGEPSPLRETLDGHTEFFALFGSFAGYVDHFLLNDLVTDDYHAVRFFKAFDNFSGDALPSASVVEYREYMRRSMAFVRARNERIARWAASDGRMSAAEGQAPRPGVPSTPDDDLRDYIEFEVQHILGLVDPRLERSRCSRCGVELPTSRLTVIKHRMSRAPRGYLGTYCPEHVPTHEWASGSGDEADLRKGSVVCPECWMETPTASGRCVNCGGPLRA